MWILQIQGSIIINLDSLGLVFHQELIIVKALTSDGILGLNLLEGNNCVLDLAQGKLCSCGAQISLHGKVMDCVNVVIPETLTIASASEIEIMARVPLTCGGTWLVEDKPMKNPLYL